MITIDLTMPIHIINMLILIVIMNAVLYRPIRSILIDRQKKVSGLEKDIETFEKNSQLRLDEFDKKLAEARAKAKEQFDSVKAESTAASSEQIAGVRKEADQDKAAKLSDIEAQFTGAHKELTGQLESYAGEMAGKILGRAI